MRVGITLPSSPWADLFGVGADLVSETKATNIADIIDALLDQLPLTSAKSNVDAGGKRQRVTLQDLLGEAHSAPRVRADGKLDGNWYGASPNQNCGLCVPCMVRRATFLEAGIPDKTAYVFESAEGQQLQALVSKRRGDIEAVKYAINASVASDAIDAGTWPPGYDVDRAEALVQRGLDELALLDLP